MSKNNKSSNYPLRIPHPVHHDMIIDDPILIKKELTKHWSKLGEDKQNVNNCTDYLANLESQSPDKNALNDIQITHPIVASAISKLKCGKAVGRDNIPSEFFKNGGLPVVNALLDLFESICLVEKILEDWYEYHQTTL